VRATAVFLLFLLALLTVALHRAAGHGDAAPPPDDLRLTTIAHELAHRDVHVRCEGSGGSLTGVDGESGRTLFVDGKPADTTFLREGVCERLHAYSQLTKTGLECVLPCDGSALETAWSLNALAHESYHLAGVRNEARTECYALQAIDFVAQRLGASMEQARQLAIFAFAELPPRMPAAYTSPDCRDGGELDLRPESAVWP
jgi:hypothetical protein